MPVVFIPHGGGPWPFVDTGFPRAELEPLAQYLRDLPRVLPGPPAALLVVSGHWEESAPTVMTAQHPPMFYDYYGFPEASYQLQWPAPGHPRLAARVRELLDGAGLATASDAERGFDHGVFVPLMLSFPDAAVPTIQVSLMRDLDPRRHIEMGKALAPLRDEGVFIVGSGMTFHNLRAFRRPASVQVAESFDAWLRDSVTRPAAERDARLEHWEQAPAARQAHPREEHLIPLMVAAGAAGDDLAAVGFSGTAFGLRLSSYHFG